VASENGRATWGNTVAKKSEGREELLGKVLNAAEQVEYQDGAIVSREIVRGKTGTVTLFAFDRGQGLSEHTAPFDALVQVLDGEVELLIGGKPVPARVGETVLMPANVPHAVRAVQRFQMLLTMIRG
jgi:quercetin dioxygenase-like cupin family protein